MKKVINGHLYNTSTAKRIGYADNGHYRTDFSYYGEALYRKRTGEYFLYKEGGANTYLSTRYGDGYGSGELIEPITYNKAEAWAYNNMEYDEAAEAFGNVSEGKAIMITLLDVNEIPAGIAEALEKWKAESGNEVITEVVK